MTPFRTVNGKLTFVIATVHTSPTFALTETIGLSEVHNEARSIWDWEDDVIILGDLNADCSYVNYEELDASDIRNSSYTWVVPDDADTNVASSKACAYDRIILNSDATDHFTGEWGIDIPENIELVSDHYPVWFEMNLNDTTTPPISVRRPYAGWTGPESTQVNYTPVAIMLFAAALVINMQTD